MSMFLDMFKITPFDLEPVLATWTDGPKFSGNRKKDPPVAVWLEQVKAGCVQRQVPEEYWHEVAEHFMGKKAKKRFNAVKKVLYEMNGESYRWTWKKFKLLMCSVGWDIDPKATLTVEHKPSGGWWVIGKKSEEPAPPSKVAHARSKSQSDVPKASTTKPKAPVRSQSSFLSWTQAGDAKTVSKDHGAPAPTQSSLFPWAQPDNTKTNAKDSKIPPSRSNSSFLPWGQPSDTKITKEPTTIQKSRFIPFWRVAQEEPEVASKLTEALVQAPLWLFLACDVLETLSQGHPKAMSAVSAILIIAGSIPAIPAITTGAAGALLASHAAQAAGAAAVSLGTWLKTRQAGEAKASGSK
ncbi:hypothetical protein GLOTRDRAFT_93229 [Gloeophyllum trabeum ATCC 11539]|uniref:Uncharacterized protein n=1 Tax=Gloeophyllum trabeum (strain ATCC 11539 / FP-39264 / Madison 617) TaxID=670483 RepID=S7Q7X3_GLOTA|nr:uncharacterized protein GLOTRDRAFT_93229 [Gloeophyllum trabeum ATCC 11539]EPQ55632.1 hypothetical protein GLOTRDRAFT_93229 [Gloeophyllum trabeum ATCC 11539]